LGDIGVECSEFVWIRRLRGDLNDVGER
jgi:hypothetical protein